MPASKRTAKPPPNCIDHANSLSNDAFISSFLPSSSQWQTYATQSSPPIHLSLSIIPSTQLSKPDLLSCFDLIAESSKHDYESSILGWHPRKKQKEMKLLDLKYILLRPSPSPSGPHPEAESSPTPILGFLSFMPTFEDGIPVLYIYEIHLSPPLRGSGLGSHMIKMVEEIAEKVGVEKVMLTCFVRNKAARRFYEKLRYGVEDVVEGRKLRGGRGIKEGAGEGRDESGYLILGKGVGGEGEGEWEDVEEDQMEENGETPDRKRRKLASS